ncbi:MAG: uracil-DNA glycosylase [Clostridia bacterium]|nr:uracil-DNA glycosylase [Clostridia bacterium]
MNIIGNRWDEVLKDEYGKPYFSTLLKKVEEEYKTKVVFPPKDQVYSALKAVDYDNVKVVILGQDPYHEKGQANGMAFAVNNNIPMPPSLRNIYAEMESDLGFKPHGTTLVGWAKQGVLLLNTTLTVREGSAQSHSSYGWQEFTDAIIQQCSKRTKPMVFILWGSNAISKMKYISKPHLVLKSAHPSPLSAYRGFFGSKPFSKANEFLKNNGQTPIDWSQIDSFTPPYLTQKQAELPQKRNTSAPNKGKNATVDAPYYNATGKIFRV